MNFNLLSALKDSSNAIVALDLETATIVAGNPLAKAFFGQEDGSFLLDKLMGDQECRKEFIAMIRHRLETEENPVIEGTIVYGGGGEKIECDLTFGYITKDKTHVFARVRPTVDNRAMILERFIATRKRPAFTLNVYDNFRINLANDTFCKAFACTQETLSTKYDNQFLSFLAEANRDEYESMLFRALIEKESDILNIPLQTAYGRTLYLFYDMTKLTLVESDWNANLYCMLVRKGETLTELNIIGNT